MQCARPENIGRKAGDGRPTSLHNALRAQALLIEPPRVGKRQAFSQINEAVRSWIYVNRQTILKTIATTA